MTTTDSPRTVKRLGSPAASALADLAAIFEDLQTTLLCCERLVAELVVPEPDDVVLEALWTTALLSYARCFAPGDRGMGLSEADITATGLKGDVLAWHKMVRTLKKHYADPAVNPREMFGVGVAVSGGKPAGVAITSTRQSRVDEQTVRQTGALAFALSRLVDTRISEHQSTVREGAEKLTAAELRTLDDVDLTAPAEAAGADGDGDGDGAA